MTFLKTTFAATLCVLPVLAGAPASAKLKTDVTETLRGTFLATVKDTKDSDYDWIEEFATEEEAEEAAKKEKKRKKKEKKEKDVMDTGDGTCTGAIFQC